jgi:Holliday junction resolvasome RuvABC endonuclease subunit
VSILSFDCATRTCGVAVLVTEPESPLVVLKHAGTIDLDESDTMANRFLELHNEILKLIKQYNPNYLAIEDLKFNRGAPNFGSLTKVAMAIGVAQMTSAMAGFEPILLTASTVRARIENKAKKNKKDETRKIVNARFKNDLVRLGYKDGLLKSHHDISDAIALGWVAFSICPTN